nr:hypothetical protein CFP56_20631 [Quercus suber]
MVIEDVYTPHSKMLSQTWRAQRHDERLRRNLYRSLSQMMLALTRVQLPCIGAFRLDDRGSLQLDNRPLSFDITTLESEEIPLDIPRSMTYTRVDTYIHDILSTYDRQVMHQPNAIKNRDDGESQALGLAIARLSFPRLLQHRYGPFFFSLTDLHQSNFFVDDDWNIVQVIDLEFSCSLPLEFQHPPFWLTDRDVGSIDNEEYGKRHDIFVSILAEEESNQGRDKTLSSAMRESWANGVFWVCLALTSTTGFQNLLFDSILPRLKMPASITDGVFEALAALWQLNSSKTIEKKLNDFDTYQQELQKAFITVSD